MTILHGDCRLQLATLPDASVDAIVTDPPYELGFMGKRWDASGIAYDSDVWGQCLRVLKPGAHLLAFGGTRTYHRMTCAIEDAGFEIRDSLHWLYGSGFPKSLDVSKAIDKAAGATRPIVGPTRPGAQSTATNAYGAWGDGITPTVAATPAAAAAAGWGTALKPAHEPIVLARKPLAGTVATNFTEYGTGALNIDACRVAGALDGDPHRFAKTDGGSFVAFSTAPVVRADGRWPANIILTHAPDCADNCAPGCPVAVLDAQSGWQKDGTTVLRNTTERKPSVAGYAPSSVIPVDTTYGGEGGASRYFATTTWNPELDAPFLYVAKPSRAERNAGLDGMTRRSNGFQTRYCTDCGRNIPTAGSCGHNAPTEVRDATPAANFHPTVKPVALIRYLIRLITPPDGTVLDPFLGSGTTAVAAILEGRQWIGCELTDDYLPIIKARVAHARTIPVQQDLFS